ncbi:hypothetical protein BH20ACT23_BH20ACT23_04530 [soil metagenome]
MAAVGRSCREVIRWRPRPIQLGIGCPGECLTTVRRASDTFRENTCCTVRRPGETLDGRNLHVAAAPSPRIRNEVTRGDQVAHLRSVGAEQSCRLIQTHDPPASTSYKRPTESDGRDRKNDQADSNELLPIDCLGLGRHTFTRPIGIQQRAATGRGRSAWIEPHRREQHHETQAPGSFQPGVRACRPRSAGTSPTVYAVRR